MLSRDAFFKKHDDNNRRSVNVTPALGTSPAPSQADGATRGPAGNTVVRTDPPHPAERSRADHAGGSRLIVGPDIKLKGVEITDCDTLVVEGTVEASMDSRVVQIAETGVFKGTVSIDVAEIRGRFEGELTAREQLIIHASGRVAGKIRYGRIKIEDGGELSGDIARGGDTRPLRATQPVLKSAAAAD